MNIWYPNKVQWIVIWVAAILAMTVWVGAVNDGHHRDGEIFERVAICIVGVGGLLVWQFARHNG